MKKTIIIFFGLLVLITLLAASLSNNKTSIPIKNSNDDPIKVYALELPDTLYFSGEQVPLDLIDVRERLDRELLVNTYWQSNMMLLLKRANRYFPDIERILKEEGVPEDFKYLAVIESGLQNVISPAGAKGFWQLMRNTAKEFGLEVNSNVDERYHLELSTRTACKYLIKAKKRFGSWTLAAASYNRGMFGIHSLMQKQQVDNYYDLLLGSETSRYMFRILAVKQIMSYPKEYGFVFSDMDLYQKIPTRKIHLDTAISNIAVFSKKMKLNYKLLKLNNPWLLENHLNNKSRKKYEITLPK